MGAVRKLGSMFEVTRDDGAVVFVPDDHRNADYQQHVESAISKGEVVDVAPVVDPVPAPAFSDDDLEEVLTALVRGSVQRKDVPGVVAKINARRAARSLQPV